MAQLKRQAVLNKEGALVRVPQNGAQGSMLAGGLNIGNETIMDRSVNVSRRIQHDTADIPQIFALSQTAQKSLTDTTEVHSRAVKRDASGALIVSNQDVTDMLGHSLIDLESLQLLKTLVLTTVRWGPRVGMTRQHFYSAIMAFLGTPGVSVDDNTLQRHHRALFDVLVQDIASASSDGNKLAALALLGQLLHFSPQLCEMLCISSTGDGTNPQLMTCITSAFQAIDESISAFLAHGGTEVASILWLAQIVFDLLMIISQQHAVQLIQINALSRCIAMKVWRTSARIVLGHTSSHGGTDAYGSENIEVYREVIKSVFLYTIRWFNGVLSALDNSEAALMPIAEFVRTNQLLFQSVLGSPYLDVHRQYVDPLTLGLFVEIGGMLYRLSCSPLVDECRALVHLFALTDLLALLTKSEFVESPIFVTDTATTLMSVASPLGVGQTASLPSPTQRQQISIAVQNILRFLLRAENLSALFAAWGENGFAATNADGTGREEHAPRLCDDSQSKELMVTITKQVVVTMENAYYSGVVQAVHFIPHIVSLHSLVLFLHAFLLLDRAAHVRDARSQWGPIVHALEEAQRVVNLWKAFHSDYIKGVRVSQASDGRWSVAAPSISNRSIYPSISARPQDDGHSTNIYQQLLDTPPQISLKRVTDSSVDGSFTNQISTVTLGDVGSGRMPLGKMGDAGSLALDAVTFPPAAGDVSIGALVEPTRRSEMVQSDEVWGAFPARDEVLSMESFLRQVKVAISNALRVASHT
ncbi:hypothetical protein TraAM80_02375 [Trypanosoma rangeli]|uniref:Uncharacterized protein n=1 Tax=Trypanosoma rangeli TaxID=5698 RepID=A0A3S5IRU9_TRYRA|nr:uncharacterized protein TraAM80_02375 [Trypanosoma rangeli]RNF08967.1 hypothetical protein TraAM80_02375 [Trypanosoma rangeli]|eukprot:RNF08967.1 hypothetical protein TraAM80_02375 [Trypanosoma rangeli]